MSNKRPFKSVLFLLPLFLGLILSSTVIPVGIGDQISLNRMNPDIKQDLMDEIHPGTEGDFALAQDSQEGVMNPILIQDSGYRETSLLRARTDSGTNTIQNITIDESNNWYSNSTEISVTNLNRLYAINGTFDTGIDPWTSSTTDGSGGANTQNATYDSSNGYIITKNTGEFDTKPPLGDHYIHYYGCEILWGQTVSNSPAADNFSLSFDFRYASGPMDPQGDDLNPLNGDPELVIYINSVQYWMSLLTLDSHDTWFRINDFQVDVPGSPPVFKIEIGILIEYNDLTLYPSSDYNDDGFADGVGNAQNITLYVDNVEFRGVDPPTFTEVDLTFNAGVLSSPITGTSGSGSATITNPSMWTVDPLQIEITSNTSVAFDYIITTQFYRDVNSSWITDLTKEGVSYSMTSGQSADLMTYTYNIPSSDYQNLTMDIKFPSDWENVSIWDALNNNITASCTVTTDSIHASGSVLDIVGWWRIEFQAPNYAKNISVQLQDTGMWSESSLFRPSNVTRIQAEIGTSSTTPTGGNAINFTWYLPNSSIWVVDSIGSMSNGMVNSSTWVFGNTNTTAGQWEIDVFWTNGTEIAFANAFFDMYHTATLTPREAYISTDVGLSFTNMFYYVDNDTGEYIIDEPASIVANWSSSIVIFQENPVHNWWEYTFDTSLIGGGSFTVVVNASLAFYDDVSSQFVIETTYSSIFDLPDVPGVPVELGLNEKYVVNMTYQFSNGTGITDASIDFTYSGPALGLSNSSPQYLGGGTYSFEVTALLSGDYAITITASKNYYYSGDDSFSLIVGETGTEFVSLNGTADLVPFGGTYHLVLQYTNSTGSGLVGATVEVVDISPSTGLIPGAATYEGNGYYSFDLSPTIASTYTLVIKANLTNHVTRYFTFNLLVTQITTVLVPDSSGATIAIDRNYTVQLTYEDELSNGIPGATIILPNVPVGLSYVVTEVGGGVYNVTLIPSVTDVTTFQISFRANKTNYQTSSTAFSLFVQTIQTDLVLLDGEVIGSVLVTDSYSVTLAYIRTDTGANITSADLSIAATPSTGLVPSIQITGEAYQVSFLFDSIGIWQITVSANRSSFVTAVFYLEVDVNPIGTVFQGFNGTADIVGFGKDYSLLVRYTNSTGYGISSAIVDIAEITPSVGIIIGSAVEEGNGYYSILFTPTSATTFSILIRANASNHVIQYLSFSLVVIPIETRLTPIVTQAEISLDQNYTLLLTFSDDGDNPIVGATITLANPPTGLTYTISEVGSGVYSATLIPSVTEATSFQMSFRANLTNYQSSTAAFSLLVQVIPTNLKVVDGVTSDTILFLEEYSVTLAYVRTDTSQNVSLADIHVFFTPTSGLLYTITRVGNLYYLSFTGNQTGIWHITTTANKTNHVTSSLQLELEVVQIDTSLNDITLVESLVYGRHYNFTFSYRQSDSSGIIGVVPTISGSAADWVYVTEATDGDYTLSLTPGSVGSFEVTLTFSLEGYVTKITTLEFDVEEVIISIVDMQGLTSLEGQLSTLSLRLVDSETGSAISGATVTYRLIVGAAPSGTDILLESITTPGQYSSTFIMPSYDSDAKIRIYVEMANHQLEAQAEFVESVLAPTASELTTLTRTFTQYGPLILLAAIVVTGYGGRRSYTKRKRKENLEALAIKRRFDDVRNMLGVIVLHKDSGIPVYSRMIKGGFDDSLISAFITAISQFRAEFAVDQKQWVVTPISDIIMAVRTQNLVCAFITTGSPTKTQEDRMIQFARAVGYVFDSEFDEAPVLSISETDEKRFDQLFNEMLDMNLHRPHKIIDTKGLPRGPKCLKAAINELQESDGFALEEMADRMAACGLEEGRVYKIIMDAIENSRVIPIEGYTDPASSPSSDAIDDSMIFPVVDADSFRESSAEAKPAHIDTEDEASKDAEKFLSDVESLLVAEKEDTSDEDSDADNPERLDLS